MKKIISLAVAAAMSLSMAAAVSAENNPSVYVDGTMIYFDDQQPVILGEGTTLVPARGVFEAMGMDVEWDAENRQVRVESANNITRVYLTIDNPEMKVWTFTSIFHADEATVALDVAPQIINDRTMIPLRAISEAMGADVQWNGDEYSVIITSKDYKEYTPSADVNTPSDENIKTGMSIEASTDSVSEGETVDIFVKVSNMPSGAYLSGVTTLVSYSPDDFEYTGCSLYRDGQDVAANSDNESAPAGLDVDNAFYLDNAVKAIMITLSETMTTPGTVARLTFKAKTSNGGDFALVDLYDTIRGYGNSFTFTKTDNNSVFGVSGQDLYLDTTPVTVSGK